MSKYLDSENNTFLKRLIFLFRTNPSCTTFFLIISNYFICKNKNIKIPEGACAAYSNNYLHYEGEYDNGLLNGKGKEYLHHGTFIGQILYEGEFFKGAYSGEGIKYTQQDYKYYPTYEGEFNEGVYSGDGVYYRKNYAGNDGWVSYEGEFEDGYMVEGKIYENCYWSGTKFKQVDLIYDGEFCEKNTKYCGYGKRYYFSDRDEYKKYNGNLIYEGNYKENNHHGHGTLYDSDGKLSYTGEFNDGYRHGEGKYYYYTGYDNKEFSVNFHEGVFDNNKIVSGKKYYGYWSGETFVKTCLNSEGAFQSGDFKSYYCYPAASSEDYDKLEFEGNIYSSGTKFSGKFYRIHDGSSYLSYVGGFDGGIYSSTRQGSATSYYWNGRISYKGYFVNGKYEGYGTSYSLDGSWSYIGDFKENDHHGYGKEYYYQGGLKYEGGFEDDHYQGGGTLYDEDGSIISQGEFSNGVYIGN